MKLSEKIYKHIKTVVPYTMHVAIGVIILLGLYESTWAEQVHIVSVGTSDRVYRGKAITRNDISKLQSLGINTVLIFKNEIKNEVKSEVALLQKNNFAEQKIIKIPFLWKDIKDFKLSCQQTLQALSVLKQVHESNDSKVLFHCTVGEDRTGYLAGLFRQLLTGETSKEIFKKEMCARGYAEADPEKPAAVNEKIKEGLTPLFAQLSHKINAGELTLNNLEDLSLCDGFNKKQIAMTEASGFRCE